MPLPAAAGLTTTRIYFCVRLLWRVRKPSAGFPHGVCGCPPRGARPHHRHADGPPGSSDRAHAGGDPGSASARPCRFSRSHGRGCRPGPSSPCSLDAPGAARPKADARRVVIARLLPDKPLRMLASGGLQPPVDCENQGLTPPAHLPRVCGTPRSASIDNLPSRSWREEVRELRRKRAGRDWPSRCCCTKRPSAAMSRQCWHCWMRWMPGAVCPRRRAWYRVLESLVAAQPHLPGWRRGSRAGCNYGICPPSVLTGQPGDPAGLTRICGVTRRTAVRGAGRALVVASGSARARPRGRHRGTRLHTPRLALDPDLTRRRMRASCAKLCRSWNAALGRRNWPPPCSPSANPPPPPPACSWMPWTR